MAESQLPFPYTAEDIASLKTTLSVPRFASYLKRAGDSETYALALYLYNARLAKAFLFPLHVVEVTLRNAIDDALMSLHGPDWPFVETVRTQMLTADGLKTLDKAIERAGRRATKDDVVATLTFDFWSNLFRPEYGAFWRTKLNVILPNLPHGVTRHELQRAVKEINQFRNRIAHHEPVLDLNAVDVMARIKTVLGYRSAATLAWMRHHSTVAQALRTYPDLQGGYGITLADRQDTEIVRVLGTETIADVLDQLGGNRRAIVRIDANGVPTGAATAEDVLFKIGEEAVKLNGMLSLADIRIDVVLGAPGRGAHWDTLADNKDMATAVTLLQGPQVKLVVGVHRLTGQATGAIMRSHRRY